MAEVHVSTLHHRDTAARLDCCKPDTAIMACWIAHRHSPDHRGRFVRKSQTTDLGIIFAANCCSFGTYRQRFFPSIPMVYTKLRGGSLSAAQRATL
jgi:hypothetical protein